METTNKKNEMGMPEALMASIGVIAIFFLLSFSAKYGVNNTIDKIELIWELNKVRIVSLVSILIVNIFLICSITKRTLFMKGQGNRLKNIRGEKKQGLKEKFLSISLSSFLIGLLYLTFKETLIYPFISIEGIRLPYTVKQNIEILYLTNFGFLALFLLNKVLLLIQKSFRFFEVKQKLPRIPTQENQVVIGTEGEEDDNESHKLSVYFNYIVQRVIKWVTIPVKGLNANVLFLGSIGTGKTAGMLIPFVEQILVNFKVAPSILALDPKANFVKELIKLLKEYGVEKDILHLKLGGPVTLNPVYKKDMLKNGNFIEVAQNFRAASANYMGKSSESPFWDNSAFNLIKNTIVYCSAVYDYFTLKEVYKVMLIAVGDNGGIELSDTLESIIDSEERGFDEEEQFNITTAIEFFRGEYNEIDKKLKSGVHATATVFMSMFNEYQANKIFCPKKEDLVIQSMEDLVNSGKILIFDVQKEGLARPMGTYIKLLYLQAVLARGQKESENDSDGTYRNALVLADEYQDLVTAGGAGMVSDVSALAKGRSKKLIFVAATQSYSSIINAVGNEKASKELLQNFRTKICGQSSDLTTIKEFQELVGKIDIEKVSRSIGENSQQAKRNMVLGGFDADNANINESVSTSTQKEYIITAQDFMNLKTYEAFGFIYDGVGQSFKKIFFKPHYYTDKKIKHKKVLSDLAKELTTAMFVFCFSFGAMAFPNICSVVKTPTFNSCLSLKVGSCTCGPWYAPRPCARVSYYVPQSFIEAHPHRKTSYFMDLPLAAAQINSLKDVSTPFGAEADQGAYSFHAHSLAVPFGSYMNVLPCGGSRSEKTCFDGMSEHLPTHWRTGSGDTLQPKFLAWSLAPKACLIKGAAMSATGGEASFSGEGGCSFPMDWMKKFLPSTHSVCNGWGTFFPRSGTVQGVNQTTASLMIASRIKSLSSEVFKSMPSSFDEKWQMISPQASSCFREGQNMGMLELPKMVNEVKRLSTGKVTGYLYTVWKRVSCCIDYPRLPAVYAAISLLKSTCQGVKK